MSIEEILELIDKMIAEWDSVKTWAGICKRDTLKELKAEIKSRIKKETTVAKNSVETAPTVTCCKDCKKRLLDKYESFDPKHEELSNNWQWAEVLADLIKAVINENIVRCKDCEFGKEACGNIMCHKPGMREHESELHPFEWFCADGKHK